MTPSPDCDPSQGAVQPDPVKRETAPESTGAARGCHHRDLLGDVQPSAGRVETSLTSKPQRNAPVNQSSTANPPCTGGPIAPRPESSSDPALDAFASLLQAEKRHDLKAFREANRTLRQLGYSVCRIGGDR